MRTEYSLHLYTTTSLADYTLKIYVMRNHDCRLPVRRNKTITQLARNSKRHAFQLPLRYHSHPLVFLQYCRRETSMILHSRLLISMLSCPYVFYWSPMVSPFAGLASFLRE